MADMNYLMNIGSSITTWVLIVGACVMALGIGGAAAWLIHYQRSFNKYLVIIYERLKNNKGEVETPHILSIKEKGKIVYDKKLKKWYFYLKGYKTHLGEEELQNYDDDREIDVPSVPYGNQRIVFLERLGVKKFAFGKLDFEGNLKVIVSNADVAEAMRSYDVNAATFGKPQSQIWAFILYIVVCVLIMVLIIYLLQQFDKIQATGKLMYDASVQNVQAANILKGNIVPSGVPPS